jgi:hypothetical protein
MSGNPDHEARVFPTSPNVFENRSRFSPRHFSKPSNPTMVSYNASGVKIYNASAFYVQKYFLFFEKRSSLLGTTLVTYVVVK